jgi:hypothetical protein
MALVPGGTFIMGKSDADLANVEDAPLLKRLLFVHSTWMKQKSPILSTVSL